MLKWVNGGTSSWAVYTTAGAQVGTTQTFTGFAGTAVGVQLGGTAAAFSSSAYIDNLAVNYSTAPFPFGP